MSSKRKIFHRLITPEEALEKLRKYITLKPIGTEEVYLEKAVGRVLAENITSRIDLPPFDRSIVDGFAVRSIDLIGAREDNPVRLKIIGKIEAGEVKSLMLNKGECVEVATGASLPSGADAVVMVEYTHVKKNFVEIYRSVSPGENISHTASDAMFNEVIAYKGTILTPQIIGALAAAGVRKVKVYVKPKIAIISTGNELIEPGKQLPYGKIYDSNSYSLHASVIEDGGIPYILGILPDNYDEIKYVVGKALANYDVIITSGSTSAGPGDIMYKILDELGEPGIIVHGLNIKPGKPTIIAVVNGKPIFGLPGYPVSCLMNYNFIVKPVIRALAGLRMEKERFLKAKLALRVYGAKGRRTFVPVALIKNPNGTWTAYPIGGTSETIVRLTRSDGYVIVPENVQFLRENSETIVYLFSKTSIGADLEFIGSHCPMVEKIMERLREQYNVRILNVGSLGGLIALKRGETEITGIHLLDRETNNYNIPFIRKYGLKNVALIKGYYREQGLIVPKNNPHNVKSFEDIIDKKLRFINRNKGSGTRVLIDLLLEKEAKKRKIAFKDLVKKIKGYWIEAKTHSAIGAAIRYDKADVGVGLKIVAKNYNLEFIPLRAEEYDFLVLKRSLEKPVIKKFIEILCSKWFKELLRKTDGYKPKENMGEIIHFSSYKN